MREGGDFLEVNCAGIGGGFLGRTFGETISSAGGFSRAGMLIGIKLLSWGPRFWKCFGQIEDWLVVALLFVHYLPISIRG